MTRSWPRTWVPSISSHNPYVSNKTVSNRSSYHTYASTYQDMLGTEEWGNNMHTVDLLYSCLPYVSNSCSIWTFDENDRKGALPGDCSILVKVDFVLRDVLRTEWSDEVVQSNEVLHFSISCEFPMNLIWPIDDIGRRALFPITVSCSKELTDHASLGYGNSASSTFWSFRSLSVLLFHRPIISSLRTPGLMAPATIKLYG